MKIFNWNQLTTAAKNKVLQRPVIENNQLLKEQCQEIIDQVKHAGDQAVIDLTRKYDQVNLAKIAVSGQEFIQAEELLTNSQLLAIKKAITRIENYHQAFLPKNIIVDTHDGICCSRVSRPIQRVGLYVPGGVAPLVSTLMMLAIPAKLAGCPSRILCTPPQADGTVNPILLNAAKLCGVDQVYKVGGAQAIAAMAYGTQTLPKVDKLFGPGNSWVTCTKMLVAQDPYGAAIDMPAGPSEVLVIADDQAEPAYVAADLLSQLEHGKDSQAILITTDENLAEQVKFQLDLQIKKINNQFSYPILANCRLILVDDLNNAFEISNQYAPEHLILQINNAEQYEKLINHAGTVFFGSWAPETMGDYITGSNHVLPTYGYARSFSSLSVTDFMKFISMQSINQKALKNIGPIAMELAQIEGLYFHKNAVAVRLKNSNGDLNE